ncbi:MAG: hypothetical protein OHK0029_02030 [Armatimonadaceae bacterium]
MRKWYTAGIAAVMTTLVGGAVVSAPLFPQKAPQKPASQPPVVPAAGDYGGWMTWEEIQQKIAQWKKKYPNLVHVGTIGKTVEGRNIPLLRFSDDATANNSEPEVLLITGMHPREQAPIICLTQLMDEILAGYGKDPRMTALLKDRQVWVVPMVNVDGKIYDMAKGSGRNGTDKAADWRKNRRKNEDGSLGVDLNRNFPIRWGGGRQHDPLWQTDTTNTKGNIYEGTAPLSEPETEALTRFISARKNLRSFMDIHSPLAIFYFPVHTVRTEHERYMKMAKGMQARQKRPYPISSAAKPDTEPQPGERGGNSGLTYTWAYYTQGIYSFNFELGTTKRERGVKGRYPTLEDIQKEYQDNFREPMLYFLEESAKLPAITRINRQVAADSQPQVSTKPVPGAIVEWKPPAIGGNWDWAVLVSHSPSVVVQSEYRKAPVAKGFTFQVDSGAEPGSLVHLTLYVWDKERRLSEHQFIMQIAGN